jgi:DNA-binding transcriptional MerR regulator
MNIGEFARRSRLSAKALRLYDELGVLPPAQVDDDTGYRYYAESQLDHARLIGALRQLQISLAEIKVILGLEPQAVGVFFVSNAALREPPGHGRSAKSSSRSCASTACR